MRSSSPGWTPDLGSCPVSTPPLCHLLAGIATVLPRLFVYGSSTYPLCSIRKMLRFEKYRSSYVDPVV